MGVRHLRPEDVREKLNYVGQAISNRCGWPIVEKKLLGNIQPVQPQFIIVLLAVK